MEKQDFGSGNAGGLLHHRTFFDILVKLVWDIPFKKNIHYRPCINLDKLLTLVSKDVIEQAKNAKDKALTLDVNNYGFYKVLGKGKLLFPIVVKTKFFPKEPEKKN